MTNKNFTKRTEVTAETKNNSYARTFQIITLIPLAFFWLGYFYSVYAGNSNNASNYSLLILAFSVMNFNVLFTKEKAVNKALNIVAKCEGIVFFVWVVVTIIQLLLK